MKINDYARFDSLCISYNICEFAGEILDREVNLFAYISCILLLYKKKPVSDWGYSFYSTDYGTPFSSNLKAELDRLTNEGKLNLGDNDSLTISDTGKREFEMFRTFTQYSWREPYLKGACSTILSIPFGMVREAIKKEPDLKSLKVNYSNKLLLDVNGNGAYDQLYDQFTSLSAVIGFDIQNFMTPAVIWLNYLLHDKH